jgi:hypothetical protein
VHVKGRSNGRRVDEVHFAVYQVHGDVLSAVYTFGGSMAARQAMAFNTAAQAAANLTRG